MRALVLLALLAACEKKPAKPPTIDSVDRTCKIDSDCTLTGHLGCCDTSCGVDVGVSVNAKAWSKGGASFRRECKEQCNVMCQKLPDCRDEKYAVCKSGVCDIAVRKTPACEAEAKIDICESEADCEVVMQADDCCDSCGQVMTKAAAEKFRKDQLAKCIPNADKSKCPRLDCPRVVAACIDKKCVKRELIPRDLGEPK